MSQSLEYYEEAYNLLRKLQNINAEFHAKVIEVSQQIPELEIGYVNTNTLANDRILAKELEEIGEAYERTKAELKAAESDQKDSFAASEESFNSFVADCIAQFEARDDLMDSGSVYHMDFTRYDGKRTRTVSISINEELE